MRTSIKKKLTNKTKKSLFGLLFASPWFVGFLIFGVYPIYRSLKFAFSSNEIFDAETQTYTFKGFGFNNFTQLFADEVGHLEVIGNFILDILVVVPIVLVFALILALLLNQNIKGKGIFRSIFFLPVVLLSGTMLSYFSDYNLLTVPSITNGALSEVINNYFPGFLTEAIVTIFSKIVLILWLSGVQILIFLAGLSKIDKSIYEAAKVDGASAWECFWKITFPQMIPLMYINVIYTTVIYSNLGSFNPMINIISSAGTSSTDYGRGYQSMLSWILFIIDILTIGLYSLVIKLSSKRYD